MFDWLVGGLVRLTWDAGLRPGAPQLAMITGKSVGHGGGLMHLGLFRAAGGEGGPCDGSLFRATLFVWLVGGLVRLTWGAGLRPGIPQPR